MEKIPDVIGLNFNEGKTLLEKHGFCLGEVKLTLAPNTSDKGKYRIVKQLPNVNNRVDLVVVNELSSS